MLSNKENIVKCVRDLKKVLDTEQTFASLELLKNTSNVETLINYALDNQIIKTLEDVFYIVAEIPEVSDRMANCIRKSSRKSKLVDIVMTSGMTYEDYERQKYGGTYNSLRDVPGYQTEWNERCVPAGVNIRGRNTGGCRC